VYIDGENDLKYIWAKSITLSFHIRQ